LTRLFTKSQLPGHARLVDVGVADRPFQILGLVETLAFGDLLSNVIYLSTLANQFDHVRMHVKFRDARPYARDVFSLSPWIDVAEPVADSRWRSIFNPKSLRLMEIGSQKGRNVPLYDMVVTSHMMQRETVSALPNPVPLRLPAARADELLASLAAGGLVRDKWFATVHYRESSYAFRKDDGGDRDSDPSAFDKLIDRIIALGGQAARLGHAAMTPFRPRRGFVDLAAAPTLVQAAAASASRFMVAGPSGAIALAWAFQVPNTQVDAGNTMGVWGPSDFLTHEVTTPGGERLRNQALRDAGLLDNDALAARMKADPLYSVRKANADELAVVAKKLYERTRDCEAWRAPATLPTTQKPNAITWPVRPMDTMPWVDLD
jgi:putative glycosyltransferase (TIGR04372 family)